MQPSQEISEAQTLFYMDKSAPDRQTIGQGLTSLEAQTTEAPKPWHASRGAAFEALCAVIQDEVF